ncbi:hypothetical protein FF098_017115 [Parvularcula flava]|uniref:Uncharacterized protein n=1 Tax=Aquisalinus luteolus TaxID=1566827 RepID=A0A8J3A784_9PROT|nr:hypothetical protein [Aquisalinus luteolus]NHK29631.1 hypothetical protein [Aquisalinus luteolus]GGI02279.1 hypothetical protein GCM10011355_34910 [Aquisalinus luteolus]
MYKKSGDGDLSGFSRTQRWLANAGSVVSTFFITPLVFGWSIDFVIDYAEAQYFNGIDWLVTLVWGFILTVTIFFLSRAVLAVLIELSRMLTHKRFF